MKREKVTRFTLQVVQRNWSSEITGKNLPPAYENNTLRFIADDLTNIEVRNSREDEPEGKRVTLRFQPRGFGTNLSQLTYDFWTNDPMFEKLEDWWEAQTSHD